MLNSPTYLSSVSFNALKLLSIFSILNTFGLKSVWISAILFILLSYSIFCDLQFHRQITHI